VRSDDGGVRLEVADDGVGFAEADRERRRADGHVGLSLLEELAAHSGTSLAIRSAPGAGTSVALELPRR
jgi:signal transduction histidine kinase